MKRAATMTAAEFAAEYGGGARLPISYLYEDALVAQARFALSRSRTTDQRGRSIRTVSAERDRDHHRRALLIARRRFEEAGGEPGLGAAGRANRRLARQVARERMKTDARFFRSGCACHACPARHLTAEAA